MRGSEQGEQGKQETFAAFQGGVDGSQDNDNSSLRARLGILRAGARMA